MNVRYRVELCQAERGDVERGASMLPENGYLTGPMCQLLLSQSPIVRPFVLGVPKPVQVMSSGNSMTSPRVLPL
jgi:hypothetical protein